MSEAVLEAATEWATESPSHSHRVTEKEGRGLYGSVPFVVRDLGRTTA